MLVAKASWSAENGEESKFIKRWLENGKQCFGGDGNDATRSMFYVLVSIA